MERGVGEEGLRGVAIEAGNLYWTTQGEGGWVGRLATGEWEAGLEMRDHPRL